jgi:DnaJ-domain-containing protein 1
MGSHVWVRDDKRKTGGKSFAQGNVVVPQAAKKQKLVWQRDPNAPPPSQEHQDSQPSISVKPAADNEEQTTATTTKAPAPAPVAPAATTTKKTTVDKAEMEAKKQLVEELRRKIEQRQQAVSQATAAAQRVEEDLLDQHRKQEEERQRRRAKLEAGFTEAFDKAKEAAAAEIAASKTAISFADKTEVSRVLNATSDYAVLKLQPGADSAAIRKRYREMAVKLHPDKCPTAQAAEAFHRLVRAYQNIAKYAR